VQIKRAHVPWLACALTMAIALPALASGSPATMQDASFGVSDDKFTEIGGNGDNVVEIAVGDKVNFTYPTGAGAGTHNVSFYSALKPTECKLTQEAPGTFPAPIPPLPGYPQNAGWAGECRFDAPGTYEFLCQAHAAAMTGTVKVLAASPSPSPSPSASPSTSPSPSPSPSASPSPSPAASAPPATFNATPAPTATPGATRAAAKPKFTTATLSRSKRTVTLQGSLAAKSGKVKLVLTYGKVKKTLTAKVKNGRFSAKLKLSRKDAKAKKLSVTLTYAGDASFAPAPAKKTL
jgi:plastocyanin